MQSCIYARLFITVTLLLAAMFPQIACSDDIDIRGVNFKQSRPLVGNNLEMAVAEPAADSIAILRQAANALNHYRPKMRLKVVGFTDDKECKGDGCVQLSLRRAKYVRDWLIKHGVAADQLLGPEGHGMVDPIDDNETEQGRARNRRTELQLIPLSAGKP